MTIEWRMGELQRRLGSQASPEELAAFGIEALEMGYPQDLDVEILPFLRELNKKGYLTVYSCAGHKGGCYRLDKDPGGEETGMVYFDWTPQSGAKPSWTTREKQEVRSIARTFGVSRVHFEVAPGEEWYTKAIFFEPVGE